MGLPFPAGHSGDDRAFRLFAAHCRMRDRATDAEYPGLADLARQAGMSPFHFLRLFRAMFRTTPHQQAMQFRLAHAKTLLVETDLPVTEICFACGYESLGSFSLLFRRATGWSPRAFRREQRRRLWAIPLTLPPAVAPFCLLDGFRGWAA